MFELEVDVTVKLNSGAKITLTDEQVRVIKNYAIELVLGPAKDEVKTSYLDNVVAKVLAKRPYNKKAKQKHTIWTDAENKPLLEIIEKFKNVEGRSRERTGALKDYQKKYCPARSMQVITAHYYDLKSRKNTNEVNSAPVPVVKNSGWTHVPFVTR